MDQPPAPDTQLAGLTLILVGSFDPKVFVEGLALRPIRSEEAKTNTVTVFSRTKPPVRSIPSRKIENDSVKFSVQALRSIPQLFDALLTAIAALPPGTAATWNSLTERTADLGIYWTNARNTGTEYDIPHTIIKALGEHGIALRISVYATDGAIDKAISERAADHNDQP